jgi:hypothetical protein
MDETKDRFQIGRTKMITAFIKALGHVTDRDLVEELQGEFFDGHVEIKKSFGVMCLMAHVALPEGWDRWWETAQQADGPAFPPEPA